MIVFDGFSGFRFKIKKSDFLHRISFLFFVVLKQFVIDDIHESQCPEQSQSIFLESRIRISDRLEFFEQQILKSLCWIYEHIELNMAFSLTFPFSKNIS